MNRRHFFLAACLAIPLLASGCDNIGGPVALPPDTQPPVVQPPALSGRWVARDLAGRPLPALVERFEDEPSVPGVSEFRLDSAEVQLSADRRYTRRLYYSEWNTLTPDDSASWRVRLRWRDRDFGLYVPSADSIVLTSEWIQNLVVRGAIAAPAAAVLRLQHGLTYGDPLLNVGYERVP